MIVLVGSFMIAKVVNMISNDFTTEQNTQILSIEVLSMGT